jgi:leader peptidase (prepilin peptidase)/N-methyltransferase
VPTGQQPSEPEHVTFAAVLVTVCVVAGVLVGLALGPIVERVPEPQPFPTAGRLALSGATAVLFGLAAARFGATADLAIYLFLFAALATVSAIDLRVRRLPDVIVLPTLLVAVLAMAAVSLARNDWALLGRAGLGAVLYFVLLFVPHLVSPRGMGFGDVKLGAVIGLAVGWLATSGTALVSLVFGAAVLGMVLGVVLGLVFRAGWRGTFPLGPALVLGAVFVIVFSDSLAGAT